MQLLFLHQICYNPCQLGYICHSDCCYNVRRVHHQVQVLPIEHVSYLMWFYLTFRLVIRFTTNLIPYLDVWFNSNIHSTLCVFIVVVTANNCPNYGQLWMKSILRGIWYLTLFISSGGHVSSGCYRCGLHCFVVYILLLLSCFGCSQYILLLSIIPLSFYANDTI